MNGMQEDRAEHGAPPASPANIEQLIEQIGSRYVTDLRVLSDELRRFYTVQLAAKDDQIAQLRQQVATLEHERESLTVRVRERERTQARTIADLRAWADELSQRITLFEDETEPMAEAAAGMPS